jgi:hypothetical protein
VVDLKFLRANGELALGTSNPNPHEITSESGHSADCVTREAEAPAINRKFTV